MIESPQELDIAVGQATNEISGFIEPRTRGLAEGIGNEVLGRFFRPVMITARNPRAANMEFAGDSEWRRVQMRIEHINLYVRNRAAYRN